MSSAEITYRVHRWNPAPPFYIRSLHASDTEVLWTSCPACQGPLHPVAQLRNRQRQVIVARSACKGCGLFTLSKGPNTTWWRDFYNYEWDQRPKQAERHANDRNPHPHAFIQRHSPEKGLKILDVGAGYGTAARVFLENGYQNVFAIEHSEKRAQHIQKTYRIPVSHCPIEDFRKDPIFQKHGRMDYIYLWHVFEHLKDPMHTLTLLRDLLEDDGFLFVAVPDFYFESFGHLCHSILHLHSFTPPALRSLVERSGFQILEHACGPTMPGQILIARKTANAAPSAPKRLTPGIFANKIFRDLDLWYTTDTYEPGRRVPMKLFYDRFQNARSLRLPYGSLPKVARLATRLFRGLPQDCLELSIDSLNGCIREQMYAAAGGTFETGDASWVTVNFDFDSDHVKVWLK